MENLITVLHNMEAEPKNACNYFPRIINEINDLFLKIKKSVNFEQANQYFNKFEDIHVVIARLMYVHKINVPKELNVFFRDFDRNDDPETRVYIYNLLKQDKYSLAKSIRD